MPINCSCHYMPVSYYQIKFVHIFSYILVKKLGAHMCAFVSLTNLKKTQKVLFWSMIFWKHKKDAFYQKMS